MIRTYQHITQSKRVRRRDAKACLMSACQDVPGDSSASQAFVGRPGISEISRFLNR